METVLLHKSAFLYVTSIFRLSSFVFANALLTGITKTFVPFYSSFPEIFYNFVLKRSKDSGQWHYSESLMFEKEQDKLLPDGNIVENMSLVIATDRDTVLMGDTVRVSLRFKNISDKDKLFYPGGVIMIYEKSMRMSSSIMPPSFILSKGKSDQLQNIPSGLVYEINYPVIVSSPLFKEGENRLMFRYHWGLNLSKKNVTDNIIYGNLYSKEVRTYVGSDLCVFGL